MRDARTKARGLAVGVGLCALATATGLHIHPAGAQDTAVTAAPSSVKPQATSGAIYYVDFRARTAASYGHAFVWYGRSDQKQVEIAGLHPATESVIPYILGHVIPVPSETGKSYGDLDDDYLTASYRVYMTEAEAKRVFAYIRHLQASSPLWNAATYNCIAFIQDIARYMGLRVPGNHLLYPEDWVNSLKRINGGRRYMSSPAVAQTSSGGQTFSGSAQTSSGRPSVPAAQKPADPPRAQSAAASY